ncbi:MAG: RiPP maturation radical SAM C-methyltransferase [Eubacteriales bacterium]|nr:RiPP maturation radical SAM C-methyltransferase [Eubacteriales bacterium]
MKNDLEKIEQKDVCLVMPPVAFGVMPSLALGILKNCLKAEGLSCYVDYANMHFTNAIGAQGSVGIYHGSLHGFLGEYIFNEAAGIENPYSIDEFIKYQLGDKYNTVEHIYLENVILHGIKTANEETEKTVQRILARNPRIVGCTAVFEQRNAALAILKRIKELRPDIITLMGGFVCFDRAGMAMLRAFPFLDYVFCGESDDIFGPCCKKMIEGTLDELPYGLLKQGMDFPEEPPHRIVHDMDLVPAPDFDDYYEMLRSWRGYEQIQIFQRRSEMRLLLETSRGCWWGAKKHCKFCGLNGQDLSHRKKSPEKVLEEIRETTAKYNNGHICFADNILPMEWFKELIPELREDVRNNEDFDRQYSFTAEIKANLTEEQVKALREAGYRMIQPGIESLSDHILKLLDKGVSGIQNVALLKYARKYGMIALWNVLFGAVGVTPEDYREQKEMIPSLEHLQPPDNAWDIIYMRNSVYYDHQEEYGLHLVPDPVVKFLSPDDPEYVSDIAFHFVDENRKEDPFTIIEKIGLKHAIEKWNKRWKRTGTLARFSMYEEDGILHFTDTREIAKSRSFTLGGIEKDVYLAAAHPRDLNGICEILKDFGKGYASEEIEKVLSELCDNKLMLKASGKYLALAIDISKEESMELSYREFCERMYTDSALKKEASLLNGETIPKHIVCLGEKYGYVFDEKTVAETDLIPKRSDADSYPWAYQY